MAPFDEAARRIADGRWPEAIETTDRPIVAAVCNLAPLELVHAAGALPARLCAGSVCNHGTPGARAARSCW